MVLPFWSSSERAQTMRVSGDTVTLTFAQEHVLLNAPSNDPILVSVANQFGGDSASLSGKVGAPPNLARTDFATVTNVSSFPGPISDAFLIPVLDAYRVWDRIREAFNLDSTVIDGLAVYSNFLSLGVPSSIVGNAGKDNVAPGGSSSKLRELNIMNMHAIRELWNARDDFASQVLLHEWGHHWLYWPEVEAMTRAS